MSSTHRYAGKPMLRLLECYVLWAIGELSQAEEGKLRQMEPQLQQVLQQQGDWRAIVAQAMELPANMPELIRAMWTKNQQIAQREHVTLTGQQFAEMFVDSNLAS